MKKWTEKEKQFVREHKDTMSRAKIAEALGLSPEEGRKVSFLIRRMKLKEEKTGKKHQKSSLEQGKKATAPISEGNTKTSKKVKKVKDITGTKEKVAKIGQKKYKIIPIEKLLMKNESFQETTSDLISKIRLCLIHKSPTHLSGHSKLRFVDDNYFVSLKNSQYLFFDENKSCFIPMNIFNGVPRKKGETRKLLDAWREQYLKNEKNQT